MIGERIKTLREKRGLTQRQFSREIGMNINTLASYERETREPRIDLIIRIAKFFEVTTDYLVGAADYIGAAEEKIGKKTQLTEDSIDVLGALDIDKTLLNRFFKSPAFSEFMLNVCTYSGSSISEDSGVAESLLDTAESLKREIAAGEDTSSTLDSLTSLSHRIYNTLKNSGNTFEADILENVKRLAVQIAQEMRDFKNVEGESDGNCFQTR